MLGVFWAMVVVSTTMVSLRFFARYKVRGFGWDDWTILVAQVRNHRQSKRTFRKDKFKPSSTE